MVLLPIKELMHHQTASLTACVCSGPQTKRLQQTQVEQAPRIDVNPLQTRLGHHFPFLFEVSVSSKTQDDPRSTPKARKKKVTFFGGSGETRVKLTGDT